MNADERIALVILQADIVFREMFFDQIHFQDECFQFRTDNDPFYVSQFKNHPPNLPAVIGAVVEI